jgi:serine protease AprX
VPGDPNVYDVIGHGTAVAGVALGDSVAGTTDGDGFFWGMGLAPKTSAYSQKVFYSNGAMVTLNEMTWANDAYNRACTVQTHSWNEYSADGSTNGQYTATSRMFDIAVRDTYGGDPDTPLPVVAAVGNVCGGLNPTDCRDRVLPPATAKNVLSVAASESWRATPGDPCDFRRPGELLAESFKNVAWMSRRATTDGRFKPDIIAPATLISSTSLQYSGWCFRPTDKYMIDSGTSFGLPQAAAAYALLSKKRGVTLSPAMLKAATIGNALSVKGGLDRYQTQQQGHDVYVAARPNDVQGFGRLYLGDALATSGVTQTDLDEGSWTPFTGAGQSRSRAFTIVDRSKPTVIVLAWTDEPAQPGANPCLVRDLDIYIQYPLSPTWYFTGNEMTNDEVSEQQYSPAWDTLNNVEMIVIPPYNYYWFTLQILERTWGGGTHNQKFAVFASNAY